MSDAIRDLLRELEEFGERNDREHGDRSRRMLNLTREAGEFLSVAVRASRASKVLEIGTSNGYSTLWIALGLGLDGGSIVTVERSDYKVGLAAKNRERAGIEGMVSQYHGEAGTFLEECADHSFDLVFLDSDRTEYVAWWPNLRRVLRPGGALIADNALSHPDEFAPFQRVVESDPEFISCVVPVGKGEFFASRVGNSGE